MRRNRGGTVLILFFLLVARLFFSPSNCFSFSFCSLFIILNFIPRKDATSFTLIPEATILSKFFRNDYNLKTVEYDCGNREGIRIKC